MARRCKNRSPHFGRLCGVHIQYEAFYVGQVFGLGLLLGAARMRTGSVILTIAMHALVNAVATLQLALEVS